MFFYIRKGRHILTLVKVMTIVIMIMLVIKMKMMITIVIMMMIIMTNLDDDEHCQRWETMVEDDHG